MTDWTARIDALLAEPDDAFRHRHAWQWRAWYERRLALAAERLREPHSDSCVEDMFARIEPRGPHVSAGWKRPKTCTCGKDSDLLRILEGKR